MITALLLAATLSRTVYGLPIEDWKGEPDTDAAGITFFSRNDGLGSTPQRIGLSCEKVPACGIVVRQSGYGTWTCIYHYAASAQPVNVTGGVWLYDDTTPGGDAEIDFPEFYADGYSDLNDPYRLKVGTFLSGGRKELYTAPLSAYTDWKSVASITPLQTTITVSGKRGSDWIEVTHKVFNIPASGKQTLRVMCRRIGALSPKVDRAEAKLTVAGISFVPSPAVTK